MIFIVNIDAQKFSLNGIPYFKNFTPYVIGERVKIVNTYDSKISLTEFEDFDQYSVNGVIHTSVSALQNALLPMLFTRNNLGGGGGGSQNLAQVLAIGGREIKTVAVSETLISTDVNKHIVLDGSNIDVTFEDLYNDGGEIIIDNSRQNESNNNNILFDDEAFGIGAFTSPILIPSGCVAHIVKYGNATYLISFKVKSQNLQSITNGEGNNSTTNQLIVVNPATGESIIIDGGGIGFMNASATNGVSFLADPQTGNFGTVIIKDAGESPKYMAFTSDIPLINERYKGTYTTLSALNIAHPTASSGDYAIVDGGSSVEAVQYIWDSNDNEWIATTNASPTTTDALTEGTINLYFTNARALAAVASALALKADKTQVEKKENSLVKSNYSMLTSNLAQIGSNATLVTQVASTATIASTNNFTSQQRTIMVSNTGGGGLSFLSFSTTTGHTVNLGINFCYEFLVGIEFYRVNAEHFAGVMSSIANPTNVSPTTFINCFGITKIKTSNNWQLMFNDSTGTPTLVDLGSNFPSNTSASDIMYCKFKNIVGTGLEVTIERINSSGVIAFTYTTTIISDLPASNLILSQKYINADSSPINPGASFAFLKAAVGYNN